MLEGAVSLVKRAVDVAYESQDGGGAAPDPKAKGGKAATAEPPKELQADVLEGVYRALGLIVSALPATLGTLVSGPFLDHTMDLMSRADQDPLVRIRMLALLEKMHRSEDAVVQLLQFGLPELAWSLYDSMSQPPELRLQALQCLALLSDGSASFSAYLARVQPGELAGAPQQQPAHETERHRRADPGFLSDAGLVRKLVEGAGSRDPAAAGLKPLLVQMLAAQVERSPRAAKELLDAGGHLVLKALVPQPEELATDPEPEGEAQEEGQQNQDTRKEEEEEEEMEEEEEKQPRVPPPDQPASSFLAHAYALQCLGSVLQLANLRPVLLREDREHGGPVSLLRLAVHLLSQPAGQTPASVATGAAQILHGIFLDTAIARLQLERPSFLAMLPNLPALISANINAGAYLLGALALVCHHSERRAVEERGMGELVIEIAKRLGPGSPPGVRKALGQCVMVVNPEYPLRPPPLAVFEPPTGPTFPAPALWEIMAGVSLAERNAASV